MHETSGDNWKPQGENMKYEIVDFSLCGVFFQKLFTADVSKSLKGLN